MNPKGATISVHPEVLGNFVFALIFILCQEIISLRLKYLLLRRYGNFNYGGGRGGFGGGGFGGPNNFGNVGGGGGRDFGFAGRNNRGGRGRG